jgi:stage II sporulation protein D
VAGTLRAVGSGGQILLAGGALNGVTDGVYRGALEFSPSPTRGVQAVNAVDLESYVRGVVSRESPANWPADALKAQAVAARTYAVTTSKGGAGWDQYPDTRSQVYGGTSAETPATDAAVAATAGQVVTYQGQPVVTYFFSTSGGQTENVENTTLGTQALPWLRSVDDPYDDTSPRHIWGPFEMKLRQAGAKLRGLVQGRFQGIDVIQRGVSPRIVLADIVGSAGRTRVSGATLRERFGLYDTWAYFTTITTGGSPPPGPSPGAGTGGVAPEARAASFAGRLTGRVMPGRARADVTVQRREGRWVTIGTAETGPGGAYAFAVDRPDVYRVVYRGAAGPAVQIG